MCYKLNKRSLPWPLERLESLSEEERAYGVSESMKYYSIQWFILSFNIKTIGCKSVSPFTSFLRLLYVKKTFFFLLLNVKRSFALLQSIAMLLQGNTLSFYTQGMAPIVEARVTAYSFVGIRSYYWD